MIPDHMLPHDVVLVHPDESTDSHGDTVYDYGDDAQRETVRAWVQQDQRTEIVSDGAVPLQARWLLLTNSDAVQRRDQIEWTGPHGLIVFTLDGQPEPAYTPTGYHHVEAKLKVVDG